MVLEIFSCHSLLHKKKIKTTGFSLLFRRRQKFIQVWNNTRVKKNDNMFCVNYTFKSLLPFDNYKV